MSQAQTEARQMWLPITTGSFFFSLYEPEQVTSHLNFFIYKLGNNIIYFSGLL